MEFKGVNGGKESIETSGSLVGEIGLMTLLRSFWNVPH